MDAPPPDPLPVQNVPPRPSTALRGFPALALSVIAVTAAIAGDGEAPARLSDRYGLVARLSVSVREISGWAPLPAEAGSRSRAFLAVSDEGTYTATDRTVRGAMHRLVFQTRGTDANDGDGDAVTPGAAQEVTLHLGDLIPRLDPAWAGGGSLLDLEACVRLPGTPDLFLLAGERNPEDLSDGGANRLYVVRYPGLSPEGARSLIDADLIAYRRLPDLHDDGINDRLEAVVALATGRTDAWQVFAFKERTEASDRPPIYFPLLLERAPAGTAGGPFSLSSPCFGGGRPSLPSVISARDRLGAQADACVGPAGSVWILDRWRREVHVAAATPLPTIELRFSETFDLFDLIEEVPGERGTTEPAAPGGRHAGYGRHEAMTFDANGWLWLAADLGERSESVVTVLAPRTAHEDGGD